MGPFAHRAHRVRDLREAAPCERLRSPRVWLLSGSRRKHSIGHVPVREQQSFPESCCPRRDPCNLHLPSGICDMRRLYSQRSYWGSIFIRATPLRKRPLPKSSNQFSVLSTAYMRASLSFPIGTTEFFEPATISEPATVTFPPHLDSPPSRWHSRRQIAHCLHRWCRLRNGPDRYQWRPAKRDSKSSVRHSRYWLHSEMGVKKARSVASCRT